MTDYKEVAQICSDFVGLYTGKKPIPIGDFFKGHKYHSLTRTLMRNLHHAANISAVDALTGIYKVFKAYRGRYLTDEEWRGLHERMVEVVKAYDNNRWCVYVALEFMDYLEQDCTELGKKKETRETEVAAA